MRVRTKLSCVLLSLVFALCLVPGVALAVEGADLTAGSIDDDSLSTQANGASSAVWHRLAGHVALDTMSKIVDEGGFAKGGTVVLTTAGGYWDALTAAGLAGMAKAPILMTDGSSLSTQTWFQISKLAPKRIIVCGGDAAVKQEVVTTARQAAGTSPTVTRCAGANAVGTAVSIYKKASSSTGGKWSSTAFICTNDGYWDALAAAPISYAKRMPIFLTSGRGSIDASVVSAMKAGGVKDVWIVGGTAAVSDSVKSNLQRSGIKVNGRLSGATAVETSEAVASYGIKLGMSANRMGVATTGGYWDALAGAALCGKGGSVLVLVNGPSAHSISGFVKAHAKEIKDGYIFGGAAAVNGSTANALAKASGGALEPIESGSVMRKRFNTRLNSINAQKAADRRMGGTTMDMIQAGNDYYIAYDALMNDILSYLDSRPDVDSAKLAASQDAWNSERERAARNAVIRNGGGSLAPVESLAVSMNMQVARIKTLIAMIPA